MEAIHALQPVIMLLLVGVVAVTLMHKHKLNVSFARFVKLAAPFGVAQIALAILYLVLFVQ